MTMKDKENSQILVWAKCRLLFWAQRNSKILQLSFS